MKLASLPQRRDGRLIVVSSDLAWYADADHIVPTLQAALDEWERYAPLLDTLSLELEHDAIPRLRFHEREACAPLPRAFQRIAVLNGANPADRAANGQHEPQMYQAGSDDLHGGRSAIALAEAAAGCEMEAQVCVITGAVPQGASRDEALQAIRLVGLVNAISLPALVPGERAGGLGFLHSRQAAAFSPTFVTPDALSSNGSEPAWRDGKLHLPLLIERGAERLGHPDAGAAMAFDFGSLIAHLAQSRHLGPGTIIGSGISAAIPLNGGDVVRIEMRTPKGRSIFGAIEQKVIAPAG